MPRPHHSSAQSHVGPIINVVAVGAATMFLGLWLMRINQDLAKLQRQADTNATNIQKMADAYSNAGTWRRQIADTVSRLNRDVKALAADNDGGLDQDAIRSLVASEVKAVQQDLMLHLEEEKTALVQAVEQKIQASQPPIPVLANPQSGRSSVGIIDDTVAHTAVQALAKRPFVTLYTVRVSRGANQTILVTDQDEVFFLDKRAEILEPAWSNHKEKMVELLLEHIRVEFRRDREAFDKAIIDTASQAILQELQARNLSSNKEITVDYGSSAPTPRQSDVLFKVTLQAGNATKDHSAAVLYSKIPGLIEIPGP